MWVGAVVGLYLYGRNKRIRSWSEVRDCDRRSGGDRRALGVDPPELGLIEFHQW